MANCSLDAFPNTFTSFKKQPMASIGGFLEKFREDGIRRYSSAMLEELVVSGVGMARAIDAQTV
jgi:hypothetical protein